MAETPANSDTTEGLNVLDDKEIKTLRDYVSQRIFGYETFEKADQTARSNIRLLVDLFDQILANPNRILDNIKNDRLTKNQETVLEYIYKDPSFVNDIANTYINVGSDNEVAKAGSALQLVLNEYIKYRAENQSSSTQETNWLQDQISQISSDKFNIDEQFLDTFTILSKHTYERPGKFRQDNPPPSIAPWQCRIGGSTFLIPPTSIKVTQTFQTTSIGSAALRQPNSVKTNLGHSNVMIEMNLFFPNHESIWGFRGDKADWNIYDWDPQPVKAHIPDDINGFEDSQNPNQMVSDEVIDYYLSSLRGLITQFRYTPFLPVRNVYLNQTYDITAVAMMGMTVSTVPDFPFVVQVTLQMEKFNFEPLLPMVDDFNQAVHWGRFRQMCGRAAARLDARANQGFLTKSPTSTYVNTTTAEGVAAASYPELIHFEGDLVPKFDKANDWRNGKHFELYYPVSTPSRIFAPDDSDFRQPGEDEVLSKDRWDGVLTSLGLDILAEAPEFNFDEYDRAIKAITQEREILLEFLKINNLTWETMNSDMYQKWLIDSMTEARSRGIVGDHNEEYARTLFKYEWFYGLFDLLTSNNKAFKDLTNPQNYGEYTLSEWKVPMERLDIDWDKCIVNGVSVSLSNNIIRQQLQLQETPIHQHLGGGDSMIFVSMTILGEGNLIKLRRLFQHINGLARIERQHGVLGFLGFKNVLTALCGLKYALPIDMIVETRPGYPHVYDVNLSLVDFDVMQQERERLNSNQQADLIEHFSKRNPFLRIKQRWSAINLYNDMPLEVRDDEGKIIGYMDPDWYFRSWRSDDSDLFNATQEGKLVDLVRQYKDIEDKLSSDNSEDDYDTAALKRAAAEIKRQITTIVENGGGILPSGWTEENGNIIQALDTAANKYESRHVLGVFDSPEGEKVSVIDFFPGGYVSIGHYPIDNPSQITYVAQMAYFAEDIASDNLKDIPAIPGTTSLPKYQREYLPEIRNPNQQYGALLQDFEYRDISGRMLPCFPTYMLWLIDEGGQFAGIKLFDNFYGLNSVVDFSVLQSQNALEDTLVLRLSNIYEKLTTPFKDAIIREDSPLAETAVGMYISNLANRFRNLESGLFSYTKDGQPNIIEIDTVRLKPGVRIHLRAGYGARPDGLDTIFNGTITEVQQGDVLTVIAQSDAIELSALVNTTSTNGHSGKIDGGLISNYWMSEPRDLMVRLLSMGSGRFKEWLAWSTKGVTFSESRYGIRHFGNILYEEVNEKAIKADAAIKGTLATSLTEHTTNSAAQFTSVVGNQLEELSQISLSNSISTTFNMNMISLGILLWKNQSAKRDYEIFKRNIYPGNGCGIAQFMGGDLIDMGLTVASSTAYYPEDGDTAKAGGEHSPSLSGAFDYFADVAQQTMETLTIEQQTELITTINSDSQDGLSRQEILDFLATANSEALSLDAPPENGGNGLWEAIKWGSEKIMDGSYSLVNVIGKVSDVLPGPFDGLLGPLRPFDILPGPFDDIGEVFGNIITNPSQIGWKAVSTAKSIANRISFSNLGKAFGLGQEVEDDDLYGYNEVSFRAQTYMKTIWDLFEVCAALLPNYIVAVRPFEDRSTVFYGKPHWLYTSGVIPVTGGIARDIEAAPRLDSHDDELARLMQLVQNSSGQGFDKLLTLLDNYDGMKDILSFTVGQDVDPYKANARTGGQNVRLWTAQDIKNFFSENNVDVDSEDGNNINYVDLAEDARVQSMLKEDLLDLAEFLKDQPSDEAVEKWITDLERGYTSNLDGGGSAVAGSSIDYWADAIPLVDKFTVRNIFHEQAMKFLNNDEQKVAALTQLWEQDPITFAFQYGWKFSWVPSVIGRAAGFGIDVVGIKAMSLYKEESSSVDSIGDKLIKDAHSIWADFRADWPGKSEVRDTFDILFPLTESDADAKFQSAIDLFLKFMWQDPYNRAWVVNAVSRNRRVLNDLYVLPGTGEPERSWDFSPILNVWKQFLAHGDVQIDDNDMVQAPTARRYMEANRITGSTASGYLSGLVEDIHEGFNKWWDENIGSMLSIIGDTLSGLIASIRLSLNQMGTALSIAGMQQKQANVLNAVLNDSRYYQAGPEGSLLRRVDNPFTREYGEPVIEVREPFQKIHYISSFDSILHNGIRENLNGVSTVITAISDGKNPVTVHFDKGIPPERQVESTVETGIYWDNLIGEGLLGVLQPLIHPLETLRSWRKLTTGSSDELSSRRIALYHLKKNLQNIYDGEIIIRGNSSIRPYDLVFIADYYSRIYGWIEVAQVMHHFNSSDGFITSIVPNAVVTINDPTRWSMLSYMWNKMHSYNLRRDVRAAMNVKIDREISNVSKEITDRNVNDYFSTQMRGSIQYTQGNTALIKDIGAIATSGGVRSSITDKQVETIEKIDLTLQAGKALAGAVGAAIGLTVTANPIGSVVGGVGGLAIGDLAWDAWKWVKENLLDQHGCYISFLNKDGEPLDAGLSYFKGVAVGTNHTISLFPNLLGINTSKVTVKKDGHYRVTMNDLLANMGYSEVDTLSLHRDTSIFINRTNAELLKITNREPRDIINGDKFIVMKAKVLNPMGETVNGYTKPGVEDGDTIWVAEVDDNGAYIANPISVRLSAVNARELQHHQNPETEYNELLNNPANDKGRLAAEYLVTKFSNENQRYVVLRIDPNNQTDIYGRTLAQVFHNVPGGHIVQPVDRLERLAQYAGKNPPIPFDSYLPDGRPYTLNWELVMTGYGNIYLNDSVWDSSWRDGAINYG